jgi:hypothetical protein
MYELYNISVCKKYMKNKVDLTQQRNNPSFNIGYGYTKADRKPDSQPT